MCEYRAGGGDPAVTLGLPQTSGTEPFTQGGNWMQCYKHVYSILVNSQLCILVNSWRNQVCENLILSLPGKQTKSLFPCYCTEVRNNVPGESDQRSLSRPAKGVATDITFDSKHSSAAPITSCSHSQPVILRWRIFSSHLSPHFHKLQKDCEACALQVDHLKTHLPADLKGKKSSCWGISRRLRPLKEDANDSNSSPSTG